MYAHAHVNPALVVGTIAAATVWLWLGYRSHVAHHAGHRLPGWEVALEYLSAVLALFCLARLVLDQLQL